MLETLCFLGENMISFSRIDQSGSCVDVIFKHKTLRASVDQNTSFRAVKFAQENNFRYSF